VTNHNIRSMLVNARARTHPHGGFALKCCSVSRAFAMFLDSINFTPPLTQRDANLQRKPTHLHRVIVSLKSARSPESANACALQNVKHYTSWFTVEFAENILVEHSLLVRAPSLKDILRWWGREGVIWGSPLVAKQTDREQRWHTP